MSDQTVDGLQVLKAMLDAVYTEAEKNPAFCASLLRSLPQGAIVEIKRPAPRRPKTTFDPDTINPLAIFLDEGEIKLRTLLDNITIANIKAVVKRHNISLPQTARAARVKKPVLIDGVVEAVRFSAREHAA